MSPKSSNVFRGVGVAVICFKYGEAEAQRDRFVLNFQDEGGSYCKGFLELFFGLMELLMNLV